jgi:tight adherence protein C
MTRALVLAVLAAVLAAAAVFEIAAVAGEGRRARTGPRARARPLVAGLAGVGRRMGAPTPPADLARRMEAAGAPVAWRVADVMAVKAGAAMVALLAALPLAAALPGRLGPVAAIGAPAGAFLLPDLWLARRIRRRGRAMADELADVLDLLRVAVDAGLSPARALGEVGRRRHGPLAAELRGTAAHIDLGVSRMDALRALERRCPVEGIAPLVSALLRAERHGAPLGPALAALAADARAGHAQRLRERAARAAPKIQLVVALLLVPAVMLLVGAALVTALR